MKTAVREFAHSLAPSDNGGPGPPALAFLGRHPKSDVWYILYLEKNFAVNQ